jgi:hypothetical protein
MVFPAPEALAFADTVSASNRHYFLLNVNVQGTAAV